MVADRTGQGLVRAGQAAETQTGGQRAEPAYDLLWSGDLPRIVPAQTPEDALRSAWNELRDRLSGRNGLDASDSDRVDDLRRIIHSQGQWRPAELRTPIHPEKLREETAA